MLKNKGQSLVEMAVITPILVLMFIGLIEVGYALWGYMTLLNVDREATRFAIRPGVLDLDARDESGIGYTNVVTHALVSNSSQLLLRDYIENTIQGNDEPKAAMIISIISVSTDEPCRPSDECWNHKDKKTDRPQPICDKSNPLDYVLDDSLVYYGIDGYDYLQYVYPSSATVTSRVNLDDIAVKMKESTDFMNCSFGYSRSWRDDTAIIVEMFYEQPQLLGFPVIAWIANPIPLYVQTAMRIEGAVPDKCSVYPIAAHVDVIRAMNTTTPRNIWSGDHEPAGGIGWLTWNPNPGMQDAVYLEDALRNPRLSANDFIDPKTGDTRLSIGDWVVSHSGVTTSDGIRDMLQSIINMHAGIVIPVYDLTDGTGSGGAYRVHSFATVKIIDFDLDHEIINAVLVEYPSFVCQQ